MKVKHHKLKQVAQGLYLCTDRRSSPEPKMEGSSGGAGYVYYLHDERVSTVQKELDKFQRKMERRRNSIQRNVRSSVGTCQ